MDKLNIQSFPLPREIALALVKSPEQIEKFCRELVERWMNGDFSSPVTEYMLKMKKKRHGGMEQLHERTMSAPVPWNFSSVFWTSLSEGYRNKLREKRWIITEQDYKEDRIPTFTGPIWQELWLIIVEEFKWDQKALSEIGRAWKEYIPRDYNYASPVLFRVVELSDDLDLLEELRFVRDRRDNGESDPTGLREVALGKEENPFLQLIEERIGKVKVGSVWRVTRGRLEDVMLGK